MLGLACPDLSGARMDLLGLTRPPSAEPRKPSPHFVKWTPLRSDLKKRFDKSRYPFFEHAEAEFLIARREGRVVGRVVAIKNDSHIDFHEE